MLPVANSMSAWRGCNGMAHIKGKHRWLVGSMVRATGTAKDGDRVARLVAELRVTEAAA